MPLQIIMFDKNWECHVLIDDIKEIPVDSEILLRGSSHTVAIMPSIFLGIVHQKEHEMYGHRFFLLYFDGNHAEIIWISLLFSFPRHSIKPKPDFNGLQFASSLSLEGPSLVIGYGDFDCYSNIIRIEKLVPGLREILLDKEYMLLNSYFANFLE